MDVTARMHEQGSQAGGLHAYARLRDQVAAVLDDLARINDEAGQSARAHRIQTVREQLLARRFTLLVLGEFKRGKSTLVNLLLGHEVLPVGATPTTAVLTRITYGEEPAARLILADGTARPVDPQKLAEAITLVQSGEEQNQQRLAGIARAEVVWPAALCRDGVDVVDSPGLGEHRTRSEITHEALPEADAVIFVSDAAQLGNEDEEFVRSRLAREDVENVFFVINKWDRVFNETEDPGAEATALYRRAWSLFVPEPKVGYNGQELRANRIYPLSCRPNLAPQEERAALDALFSAFREDLESFLVREAGRVALDRALVRARALVAETQGGLRARLPLLDADLAEFERRAAAAEAELQALEAPRQAIRNAIAARRQAIRQEVRRRATKDLPRIEAQITEDFRARVARPKAQVTQRILDSMQDSFRRQKIRDELRLQAREIALAKMEPWAGTVSGYVEEQVRALLDEVREDAGAIDTAFAHASRILLGLDAADETEARDQEDLLKRGVAAGIGALLLDPFLIMSGGMHGFKGLGRTMLYQFAGLVVASLIGLPALPVLVAGAMIATVQNNEDLVEALQTQALDEVLQHLRALHTTGLGDLEAQATAPLEACSTAIEQAIEGRIADHREQVAALREQVGTARGEHGQARSRVEDALAATGLLADRLTALA